MAFSFKKWSTILGAVAPMVLLVVPGGAALAPFAGILITGIAKAQKDPGKTNAEKKEFVQGLVSEAVKGTNAVKANSVDEALVLAASDNAIDAIIGTIKVIQKAHEPQPVALPPPLVESLGD